MLVTNRAEGNAADRAGLAGPIARPAADGITTSRGVGLARHRKSRFEPSPHELGLKTGRQPYALLATQGTRPPFKLYLARGIL